MTLRPSLTPLLILIAVIALSACQAETNDAVTDAASPDVQTSSSGGDMASSSGPDLTSSSGGPDLDASSSGDMDMRSDADMTMTPMTNPPPHFRVGVTYPAGVDVADNASLASRIGLNGILHKFPITLFDEWGYNVQFSDLSTYQGAGVHDQSVYLIGMPEGESTAAAGADNSTREKSIPDNLYVPIWNGDCQVNPENYWARHLFGIMSANGALITTWGIWFAPDQAAAGLCSQWLFTSPDTGELTNLENGDLFDYVRMLRIAAEVRDCAAPETHVAVGVVTCAEFLSALGRYTDNPIDGDVSPPNYPKVGLDYVDAVQLQRVPQSGTTSDTVVDSTLSSIESARAQLDNIGFGDLAVYLSATAVPTDDTVSAPSGEALSRNFTLKSIVLAWRAGLWGYSHRYLANSSAIGGGGNRDSTMGLFPSSALANPSGAAPNDTGVGIATLRAFLDDDIAYDSTLTQQLPFNNNTRGAAFTGSFGKRVIVAWSRVQNDEDEMGDMFTFDTTDGYTMYTWDHSQTGGSGQSLSPEGGQLSVQLTGSPIFLVKE